MENGNITQPIPTQAREPVMINPVDIKPIKTSAQPSIDKTSEKEKSKCNFCNRCETCQASFDKDKTKGKDKKEIEGKCKVLNYFILFCIFILMFVSNMALWLTMAA